MISLLRDLMAHAEWADAVWFHTWGKAAERECDELRRRVAHIVGVQQGFLSILKGESPGGPPDGPPPTYDELKTRGEAVHAAFRDHLAAMEPANLTTTIRVPWFPDPPCVITTAEAIVQAAMHSQHHRGQCMTRLKDFGGEPKNVDWIIWLWKQKPRGRWS